MSKFHFKTRNVKDPKNLQVDTTDTEENWVKGLKQVYGNKDKVDGYVIQLYRCMTCNSESTDRFAPKCCGMHMRPSGIVREKVVKDIRSRTTGFQCPACKTVYAVPMDCCLTKEKLTKGELVAYGF